MGEIVYLGPSATLDLGGGVIVKPGDPVEGVDEAVLNALEKAGLRFSGRGQPPAPQAAAENLAAQGTTAETQADRAGLSATGTSPTPKSSPSKTS